MQRVIYNITKRNSITFLVYGNYRERADSTKQARYEHYLMKLVGLAENILSLAKCALRWNIYNNHVHLEIKHLRGRMNARMKTRVCEGMYKLFFYFIVILISPHEYA